MFETVIAPVLSLLCAFAPPEEKNEQPRQRTHRPQARQGRRRRTGAAYAGGRGPRAARRYR